MNKVFLIVIIALNFSFTNEIIKFIFWNNDTNKPLFGDNKVEFKLRVNNDDNKFKKISPKKQGFGRESLKISDEKYHVYRVEAKFNDLLIGDGGYDDCEKNKLYLEFKVNSNGNFYTGSQILIGDFWDCQKIGAEQSMSSGGKFFKKKYFSNSEIINPGGDGDIPTIKIFLNPPKLRISGNVIDFKTREKIDIDNVNIYLNREAKGNLSFQKIISSKEGHYIREVQLNPDATDLSGSNYKLYFVVENYYSKFIDINGKNLLNGKNQIENIELFPRYPFSADLTQNPSDGVLFYNEDCMRWMCKDNLDTKVNEQKKQIYISKIDQCTDRCKEFERSQIVNGIHECVPDYQLENESKSSKFSYDSKLDSCINETLESFENSDFNNLFSDNISPKKNIQKSCKEKISKNVDEDMKNEIFKADFLNDYNSECVFDEYIEDGLCDELNTDIMKDYYFLIKITDAIYQNIREKYNDELILSTIKDNVNSDFNDIERLILLYNQMDVLMESKSLIQLKSDYFEGDVPNYLYISLVAEHYLKRIQFYLWYTESIFYFYKKGMINEGQCKNGGYCHRVFDEEYGEYKVIDFSYLCNNYEFEVINNTFGTKILKSFEKKLPGQLPTLKNMKSFIEFLQNNIEIEIDNYKSFGSLAAENENYQFFNIINLEKKVSDLMKQIK